MVGRPHATGRLRVHVIREAVGEVEAAWSQQLGSQRFAQLRELLLALNEAAARDEPASSPGEV